MRRTERNHVLAETFARYGPDPGRSYTKVSISLPSDLLAEVRQAASQSGSSVSAVITSALRSAIDASAQARLDDALDAQADEVREAAEAYVPTVAALWSKLEW